MSKTVAISSCWSSARHKDGYEMVREFVEMGFTQLELSHGVRMSLVPGILKAVEEGMIEICSVHNFCPLPPGIHYPAPNLYQPSSGDRREQEQWLRYTRQTMEFANRLGARKIVLHLGSISFFWRSPAIRLRRFVRAQGNEFDKSDAAYQQLREKIQKKLERKLLGSWEHTLQALETILPEAEKEDLYFCCENRESFEELPLDNQFSDLFTHFSGQKNLLAWHDTGHAKIKEKYGFLDHENHLKFVRPHLGGFHLHDVSANGRDHQPIGSGEIDFTMLARYFQPEDALVLELSPGLDKEEVLASKKAIESLLD
ncbi:MAG: sugar phosphate isomerase/epimerase [Opitutales bacterium]|nr:sugar phosphate isomerase/epimerase [Opitutales bacterium]